MIGIIILNYNTWEETEVCVDSIRKFTSIDYKIFIVDNNSKDNSGDILEKKYKLDDDVWVIKNLENNGYSAGNNVGIQYAEKDGCDYIFIVNSDVELLNDAFSIMLQTLKDHPECMMIGPSVMDNNHRESQLPRLVLTPRVFVFERHPFCLIPFFAKKAERKVKSDSDVTVFYGSVAGCCFGIKTSDFRDVGFFDENVFLYYEEDILGYKMMAAGKKAVFDKRAKIWHKANISTNKEGSAFVQFHRWTSVLYMLKQYAKINKIQQISIALWNIITWDVLSIKSKKYRVLLKDFRRKNWDIIRGSSQMNKYL